MKLQSESVPEKRQSWAYWDANGKETIGLENIEVITESFIANFKNVTKERESFIYLESSEKEQRNSPEPSERFPNPNIILELSNQDLPPHSSEFATMGSRKKEEELKSMIPNGGLSLKEQFSKDKRKSDQSIPVVQNNERNRQFLILDNPEPMTLSRLETFREVLRIVLNIGLLLGEGAAWITMYGEMDATNQEYILLFLILPTVTTASSWLACNWCNKSLSWTYFSTVFCLLLLSIPSPIFLHLFYLYEVTKCVGRSRPLGNLIALCQLCHAFTGSLPLLMSGLYMLLQAVITDEKSVAINHIAEFLEKHSLFAPAMLLSLMMVVTGVHRYNERRTSTLLSILVTIPFTLITLTTRTAAVSVILAFHPAKWSLILFSILASVLLIFNLLCQANLTKDKQKKIEDESAMVDCWSNKKCSFFLHKVPRLFMKASADIFVPLGYDNDSQLGQGAVRGSWQIVLNYLIVMTSLGVGLATAVLYYVPNTYQGLEMTKMGMQVEIPETSVILRTGSGMDIEVKMPATNLDLANSANLEASIATDETMDMIIAVAVPLLLVLVSLPVTITRVAMIGMNCLVVRQELMATETGHQSLKEEIHRARKGISGRLCLSICCGVGAAVVTSLVLLAGTSLIAVKLFS